MDASDMKAEGAARVSGGWFRRWFLALVFAGTSVFCAVVLFFQKLEIQQLQESNNALTAVPEPESAALPDLQSPRVAPARPAALSESEEIAQLQQQVQQLKTDLAQLDQLWSENDTLRAQLAARPQSPAAAGPQEDKARKPANR